MFFGDFYLGNKFKDKVRILTMIFCFCAVIFACKYLFAQETGPQAVQGAAQETAPETSVDVMLTEDEIYKMAGPALNEEKSALEAEILSINPAFETVSITPGEEVNIKFTRGSTKGQETLSISTNPAALAGASQGAPISIETLSNWLISHEQPFITNITATPEASGINIVRITSAVEGFTYNTNDAPVNMPSEGEKKEGFFDSVKHSSIIEYYRRGGLVMHFILLNSIWGIAIFIERLYVLRRKNIIPNSFVQNVMGKIMENNNSSDKSAKTVENNFKDILRMCKNGEGSNSPFSRVLLAGAKVHHEGFAAIKGALESATGVEAAYMEKNMGMLALLSNLAPLLGFLGTVTGMIAAFESIARMASTRPEVVGGGIAEALLTTAYGLFVGIPLLLCHYTLQGKEDTLCLEIEELAVEILEMAAYGGNNEA